MRTFSSALCHMKRKANTFWQIWNPSLAVSSGWHTLVLGGARWSHMAARSFTSSSNWQLLWTCWPAGPKHSYSTWQSVKWKVTHLQRQFGVTRCYYLFSTPVWQLFLSKGATQAEWKEAIKAHSWTFISETLRFFCTLFVRSLALFDDWNIFKYFQSI